MLRSILSFFSFFVSCNCGNVEPQELHGLGLYSHGQFLGTNLSDEFAKIYAKSPIGEASFFVTYAQPEFCFHNNKTYIWISETSVMTRFEDYSATYHRPTTAEEKAFFKKLPAEKTNSLYQLKF